MLEFSLTVVSSAAALLVLLLVYQYVAQNILHISFNTAPNNTQQQTIDDETLDEYLFICEIFMNCVKRNYNEFKLDTPGDIVDHIFQDQVGIRRKNDRLYYVYRFRRRQDKIDITEHQTHYNTTPAASIARMINDELPRYCTANGMLPHKVYKSIDGKNGWIAFVVSRSEQEAKQ